MLNPSPSPAGSHPALACGAGPQEAKYDLKVYTPYTSNNMFHSVVVEVAPLALFLKYLQLLQHLRPLQLVLGNGATNSVAELAQP